MEHDSPSERGHENLGALTHSFPHCFIASGGGVSSFFGYHSSDCWHQSTTSLTVLSPGGPLQHVSLWLFVGLANGWRFAFLVLYQALGLEKAGCATRVSNAATGYPLPLLSGLPSLDTFAFGFDVPVAHLSRSGFQRSTMPDTLAGFYYTGQFWGPDSEVS